MHIHSLSVSRSCETATKTEVVSIVNIKYVHASMFIMLPILTRNIIR